MSPGVAKASVPTFKAEPFTMLMAGFSMIDNPASTVNTFGVPIVRVIEPDLPPTPASESKAGSPPEFGVTKLCPAGATN